MPYIVVSFNHSKAENTKEIKKMRSYTIKDKTTRNYIGTVRMTPDQAKKAQADFIIKEA